MTRGKKPNIQLISFHQINSGIYLNKGVARQKNSLRRAGTIESVMYFIVINNISS